jgi:hypothetical protein
VARQAAEKPAVAVVEVVQRLFDVHAPGVLWHLHQQPAEVEKGSALQGCDKCTGV